MEELLAKAEPGRGKRSWRITVQKELELEFDLGNLLASDRNPRPGCGTRDPHRRPSWGPWRGTTQLLINQLWQLPTERVEEGAGGTAARTQHSSAARKPVPQAAASTLFKQQFAPQGHPSQKTNLVWDEVRRQWRRRWGYQRLRGRAPRSG